MEQLKLDYIFIGFRKYILSIPGGQYVIKTCTVKPVLKAIPNKGHLVNKATLQ